MTRHGPRPTSALLALLLPVASLPVDRREPAEERERAGVLLTREEIALALELSPVPAPPPDPTNAVSDSEEAARFGEALFHDPRLSRDGTVSCATCHSEERGWSDGQPLPEGVGELTRHTLSLWNVGHQRWFFWDGRKDSLWSQALAPLEDPREHGSNRTAVAHAIASDPEYRAAYQHLFGPLPELSDAARFPTDARPVPGNEGHPHARAWSAMAVADRESVDRVFVAVGKSIAAFERTIVSGRAPFDVFVEGLREDDAEKLTALTPAAQRGFSLFVGKAQCLVCHDGPVFSNLEFQANRVPHRVVPADPGRPLGIRALKRDAFNSLSRHADDGGELGRRKLAIPPRDTHLPGEFKVPTLRNVAQTAPYMHEGQLATLEDVVAFYSTLEDSVPLGPGGGILVQPLGLTVDEQRDLVAFLESLTALEGLAGPPPRDGALR